MSESYLPLFVIASPRSAPTHKAKASWGPEGMRGNPWLRARAER
jgi:hypothetical protein